MALSQEFWLQQRRREASAAQTTAPTLPPTPGVLPPLAAATPAVGAAAVGHAPAMAGASIPGAMTATVPGALPQAATAMAAFTGPVAGAPVAAAAVAPGCPGALGLLPALQDNFLRPPQLALPAMQAMSFPRGANMLPGMPWVAPQQRALVDPVYAREHKPWNSDDEDIDEFGRKKRKSTRRKADTPSAVAAALPAAMDSAARLDRPEADPDTAEPPRKSAKTKGLSAKQQAALERLHGRSKQRLQENNDAGQTASASSTAAAPATNAEPAGLGIQAVPWMPQVHHTGAVVETSIPFTAPSSTLAGAADAGAAAAMAPWMSHVQHTGAAVETSIPFTAPSSALAGAADAGACAAMAAAMAAAGWPTALLPPHASLQLPAAAGMLATAAPLTGPVAMQAGVPTSIGVASGPMGQQPRVVLPPAWRAAPCAGVAGPSLVEHQQQQQYHHHQHLMDATSLASTWPGQCDDMGFNASARQQQELF